MIVCSCNALTHRDIETAVEKGASRPAEIYAARNCRAQCGGCVGGIVCVLRALLRERGANDSCAVELDQPSRIAVHH
ncbi:(2Fe-2S)-binding protein [Neoasaia chiangmaiensis]|uniref:(2Fe-2S)-binding protein n=1 Tax=Neoasaia chiangmaiensis TaxID=320497 RepID=UPI00098A49A4|nr:(2Fe-2S)-binding protein [Neoasaia chiangmaiensis]